RNAALGPFPPCLWYYDFLIRMMTVIRRASRRTGTDLPGGGVFLPMHRTLLILLGLVVGAAPGRAHYNILLPEKSSTKVGQAVSIIYLFGHPFEHQLFRAPPPADLVVVAPDGTSTDLLKSLEKVPLVTADKKQVVGYRVRFTPKQRGDYTFLLKTPPIWVDDDREFLQDTV